jgi:deoxyadenosine/deoxycytidine kinase
MDYKVAFTGSSGSGKTTLVTYVAEKLGLRHISGSAGDVKQEGDKMLLDEIYQYPGGGHVGVIRYSALNPEYGLMNQKLLQMRRSEIIFNNTNFVTDRSPIDNMTYMINQVGYHPHVTDAICEEFLKDCMKAFEELTHLIYVKAVQPKEVEFNGSRVANSFYQRAIDAQFDYWLKRFDKSSLAPPEILVIDYWDLERRKKEVLKFLDYVEH